MVQHFYKNQKKSLVMTDNILPSRCGTILLVSMDGGCMQGLAHALTQEGYWVCLAVGLADALVSLQCNCPDLIIFNGPASPDDWRALRRVTSVPVLALLPRPTAAQISGALEAGADDCQATSMGTWETLSRVHALLRRGVI
jgi:DNA-binding response OmpR family regulator